MIKQITIVSQPEVKTYSVGQSLDGGTIHRIELGVLYLTGDPYSYYIGYDEGGKILFTVNPMCPVEVEYL